MSLALAGGLFTTEPPEEPLKSELILEFKSIFFFSPMGLDIFLLSVSIGNTMHLFVFFS